MDVVTPPGDCTVWHYAWTGEVGKLSNLISHSATHVDTPDEEQRSPLHYSASGGSLACVLFLLDKGANPNQKDAVGFTPLQNAAYKGHLDTVKTLIDRGAEVNTKDNDESTPLHKAALLASPDCLLYLISKGAEVTARTANQDTPIHYAAVGGSVQCIEALLKHGAKVECIDQEGVTPLHQAAFGGHAEAVAFLLKKGARVDAKDVNSVSPLHSAACSGSVECVDLLVQYGEFVNVVDTEGVSPLHQACFNGHAACTKRLVQLGAKVDLKDEMGETPLHKAGFNGHVECAAVCLEGGVDIDSRDAAQATPLHFACFNGYSECVDFFINSGAQVNNVDDEGATPLHKAAFGGYSDVIKLLVKGGAKVTVKDREGATALHKAAFSGKVVCITALIKAGADVEVKDGQGGTPLHNAAYNGFADCVMKLIQKGAFIDAEDNRGSTPLHLASAVGSISAVEALIGAGASVDCRNQSGKTPLLYAMKKQHGEVARVLIRNGADIHNKDNKNRSSVDLCKIFGTIDIVEIMAMAKVKREDQPKVPDVVDEQALEAARQEEKRKELLKQATTLFNQKPNKAIDFCEQNGLLTRTPKEVSNFLHTTENLSKKIIGEYLGEGDEFNVQVLTAFVEALDFSGLDFDQGLRRFLCKFRLPGEAQKIDRMMERFAQQFYAHNPDTGVFCNSDTVYILAFSTIMLNTDSHNPNIKKKMTKAEFLYNNRGINGGDDVPPAYMGKLYDNIVNDEIKMETGGTLFNNASKKGYLVKQGGRIKTWRKRWFILSENCLFYFKNPADAEPCGIIPLENITVTVTAKDPKRPFCFILQNHSQDLMKACKVGSDGTLVKANHLSYSLSAATATEMESWISAINSNVHKNPFVELMHKKEANFTKKFNSVKEKKRAEPRPTAAAAFAVTATAAATTTTPIVAVAVTNGKESPNGSLYNTPSPPAQSSLTRSSPVASPLATSV